MRRYTINHILPRTTGSQPVSCSHADEACDLRKTKDATAPDVVVLLPEALVVIVYTSENPMSVLLKQLVSLTLPRRGSLSSTNVMSTH